MMNRFKFRRISLVPLLALSVACVTRPIRVFATSTSSFSVGSVTYVAVTTQTDTKYVVVYEDTSSPTTDILVKAPQSGSTAVTRAAGSRIMFSGTYHSGMIVGYIKTVTGTVTMAQEESDSLTVANLAYASSTVQLSGGAPIDPCSPSGRLAMDTVTNDIYACGNDGSWHLVASPGGDDFSAFTDGSVVYTQSGGPAQDNARFNWDQTTHHLAVLNNAVNSATTTGTFTRTWTTNSGTALAGAATFTAGANSAGVGTAGLFTTTLAGTKDYSGTSIGVEGILALTTTGAVTDGTVFKGTFDNSAAIGTTGSSFTSRAVFSGAAAQTDFYGFHALTPANVGGDHLTNGYGMYIDDQFGGTMKNAALSVGVGGIEDREKTAGSILYVGANKKYAEDNGNFVWDAANKTLSLGSSATTGPTVFQSSGLDDLVVSGDYVLPTDSTTVIVQIDSIGTPDTFRWAYLGEDVSQAQFVAITGAAQALGASGLSATFGATTGHEDQSQWYTAITVSAPLLVKGVDDSTVATITGGGTLDASKVIVGGDTLTAVGTSRGPVIFTGAGLNDATFSGTPQRFSYPGNIGVTIDATGTPDTFTWDVGGTTQATGVPITGGAQFLAEGVSVTFAATTGHTLANLWTQPVIVNNLLELSPVAKTSFRVSYQRTVVPSRLEVLGGYTQTPQPQSSVELTGAVIFGTEYDGGAAVTSRPLVALDLYDGSVDSGSVSDSYGLRINDIIAGATHNTAIKTGLGDIELGPTASPSLDASMRFNASQPLQAHAHGFEFRTTHDDTANNGTGTGFFTNLRYSIDTGHTISTLRGNQFKVDVSGDGAITKFIGTEIGPHNFTGAVGSPGEIIDAFIWAAEADNAAKETVLKLDLPISCTECNALVSDGGNFKIGGPIIAGDDVTITPLAGAGNGFACFDTNGKLYRSATACVL